MTPWERYDGPGSRSATPRLSIYPNGDGRINAAADREFFQSVDAVTVYVDDEAHRLALVPGAGGQQPLTLTRSGKEGGDIAIKGSMRRAGVDPDRIEETEFVELEEEQLFDDTTGMVADLSDLVDDDGSQATDAHAAESESGESSASENPDTAVEAEGSTDADTEPDDQADDPQRESSGVNTQEDVDEDPEELDVDEDDPKGALRTYLLAKTSGGGHYMLEAREIAEHVPLTGREVGQQLRYLRDEDDEFEIHYEHSDDHPEWNRSRWGFQRADTDGGSSNLSLPETPPPGLSNGDDSKSSEPLEPDVGEVQRACDRVDTVQELADELNLTPGQARNQAKRVGAYADLTDQVERPGVDR